MSNSHIPVLLKETIDYLNIKPNGVYVDCTFGRGGHSLAILNKLSKDGLLICVDKDPQAIEYANQLFKNDKRVIVVKNDYSKLDQILKGLKIDLVDGIVADLGISSPQIDNPERGFSYRYDAYLDMRMDLNQTLTAWDVLNKYKPGDLIWVFQNYGEIKNAKFLVSLIIKAREKNLINSTFQFYDIIKSFLPIKEQMHNKYFANNFFQAIRIEVNNEFNSIKRFLNLIPNILNQNARLCVITFHSLEDKIVTNSIKKMCVNNLPVEIPINDFKPSFSLLTKKAIVPTQVEITSNPRCRSSRLRVMVKN